MPHPNWCGKKCCDCTTICGLDESIPCSPDCEGLNPDTGIPDSKMCGECDAIKH